MKEDLQDMTDKDRDKPSGSSNAAVVIGFLVALIIFYYVAVYADLGVFWGPSR